MKYKEEIMYMHNEKSLMRRNKNYLAAAFMILAVFTFFIFVSGIPAVSAANDNENITAVSEARECLEESRVIVNGLLQDGFNIERVNETLQQAQAFHDDTVLKKKKDFYMVVNLCDEIKSINEIAYISRDEFNALKKFYNDSLIPEMNTSSVDSIMSEIENEIASERYEKVEALIDSGYEAIINLRASYGTVEVLKRNTQNFLIRFFVENWKPKLAVSLALIFLFLIFRKKILSAFILNKMKNLEIRRSTLKELIRKTQKDYFEYGSLPEGTYNIRTKKFAELIRDIDRQVPLLKEELAKLGYYKKVNSVIVSRGAAEMSANRKEKKEKNEKEK